MSPHWGSEALFSSVPLSNSLGSISDPRRAFWADTAPFSGPWLASCVASGTTEIQRHRQVCRARRGGPRTPSYQLTQTLILRLLKTHFFSPIIDCEKSTKYYSVSDQTCEDDEAKPVYDHGGKLPVRNHLVLLFLKFHLVRDELQLFQDALQSPSGLVTNLLDTLLHENLWFAMGANQLLSEIREDTILF